MRTLFLSLITCLPLPLFAQDVGDTVIVIEREAELKVGNTTTTTVYRGTHLRVDDVNADWFWVMWKGDKGWIQRSSVIPLDQGVDHFTEAIRKDPKDASAYQSRAMVWNKKGEHDIAIGDCNEAIRLDPKNATAYANRGYAWSNKGEYDKAISDYNEAIRLDPKNANAYIVRGIAWDDKGEYDKAISDYNEAIRLDPKEAMAYNNRGVAWYRKNEYDKAISDYNEAVRLDPKHELAYGNRGFAWASKGEHDKAITDYNEFIRLNPNDANGYNHLAWLLATCPDERYRDGKRAFDLAKQACKLDEYKSANIIGTLAAAYAECRDFEKAVQYLERAMEMEPDNEIREKMLQLFLEGKPYRDKPK